MISKKQEQFLLMLLIDRLILFNKKLLLFIMLYKQISFMQEPEHPIWEIISVKQCCGIDPESFKTNIKVYQWFIQSPFLHFCPGLHLNRNQIIQFEQAFKTKYAPQGTCLPILFKELKIELTLISICLGCGILLMLLSWLFIWQHRSSYLTLFKNILNKQENNSINT